MPVELVSSGVQSGIKALTAKVCTADNKVGCATKKLGCESLNTVPRGVDSVNACECSKCETNKRILTGKR